MTETNIIRIEEQQTPPAEGQSYTANLIFNHREHYPCQIRDPFAEQKQQEEELEWYFETYLEQPFTPKVRARNAAESIRTYGSSLFSQIFVDPQALFQYRQAIQQGLHTIQLEIAGTSSFHRLHWEALYDPKLNLALALHAPIIRQNLIPQTWTAEMKTSSSSSLPVQQDRVTWDIAQSRGPWSTNSQK